VTGVEQDEIRRRLREHFDHATPGEKAGFLQRLATLLDDPHVIDGETPTERAAGDTVVAELRRLACALDGEKKP